jgi:hypothetical protein
MEESRPGHWFDGGGSRVQRWTLKFSAEVLPRFDISSYSTAWPSFRVERPALSTADICTNTSLPPPLRLNKPVAFGRVEHFTVPLAIASSPGEGWPAHLGRHGQSIGLADDGGLYTAPSGNGVAPGCTVGRNSGGGGQPSVDAAVPARRKASGGRRESQAEA